MSARNLSTLAVFDDIRRCINVLTDGTAEEEFLRVLRLQEKFRQEYLNTSQEVQRIQTELNASLHLLSDLETKLFHARRLLEMENKARRQAEYERDQLEKKMIAVADFVQQEVNTKDETVKEKFAFLSTLPRKRKSLNPHVEEKYGNDINSTGSFLSDLSITQSEDDFLESRHSRNWQRHRPSLPKNPVPQVGGKRSRVSVGGDGIGVQATPPTTATSTAATGAASARRSGTRRSGVQQHTLDVAGVAERICATTKVTIPQDGNGAIRAESKIERMPIDTVDSGVMERIYDGQTSTPVRSPPRNVFKDATAPPMTPASAGVMQAQQGSGQMNRPAMMRQHNFVSKTFIRADTCKQCQRKIRFGSVGLRCRDCPIRCHVDCRYLLAVSCERQSNTPIIKGPMGYIADYVPNLSPMIPALIVHCVNEIEMRGLNEVGLYRVSGTEREVKALKERFMRSKGTPHLTNIDVHVLCGCLKDFLRSLREPLIPTGMWKDFCNAVQSPTEEEIKKNLYNAVETLPEPNRDTLAFLILHFQRVAECGPVMMPIENIARVFGPTIVGYSSHDPDQHAVFTEVYTQYNVMLNLMKIPMVYWTQYTALDTDKENETGSTLTATTPRPKTKESLYSLYATPLKSTMKKRKFLNTPPYSAKK